MAGLSSPRSLVTTFGCSLGHPFSAGTRLRRAGSDSPTTRTGWKEPASTRFQLGGSRRRRCGGRFLHAGDGLQPSSLIPATVEQQVPATGTWFRLSDARFRSTGSPRRSSEVEFEPSENEFEQGGFLTELSFYEWWGGFSILDVPIRCGRAVSCLWSCIRETKHPSITRRGPVVPLLIFP